MEDKVITFLNSYGYGFKKNNNVIVVNLGQKLFAEITVDHTTMYVQNILKGWNPITGFIESTLKKAVIFNTIGLLIMFILLELSKIPDLFFEYDYSYMLIIFISINFLWFFYYLIRFEAFKTRLIIAVETNRLK